MIQSTSPAEAPSVSAMSRWATFRLETEATTATSAIHIEIKILRCCVALIVPGSVMTVSLGSVSEFVYLHWVWMSFPDVELMKRNSIVL